MLLEYPMNCLYSQKACARSKKSNQKVPVYTSLFSLLEARRGSRFTDFVALIKCPGWSRLTCSGNLGQFY